MTAAPDARRILVVEDEMLVAMLLEDMIAALGHAVVGPFARIDEAMEAARHAAVDAAILDVNLDGRESYPVAEALAARDVPFAFATGYGSQGLRDPWRGRPTLQKPFRQRDLDMIVSTLLSCPG
jgi:CheY-like chemotaxis protein